LKEKKVLTKEILFTIKENIDENFLDEQMALLYEYFAN
jgi:hypothetical protein